MTNRSRLESDLDADVEAGGLVDVVGEAHVSNLLLLGPSAAEDVVGAAGAEGGVQPGPTGLVDPFDAEA